MITVRFLGDEYSVDTGGRKILSLACNVPAKDFYAILLLHYLAARFNGLPTLAGEWVDFKEIARVEGYEGAFRGRCIEPIIRKYGSCVKHLLHVIEKLPGKVVQQADAAVVIQAFEGVPVLVTLWGADDEFSPDANMLFDRSITSIFCVEDVVVLGQILAHHL
jgi:hypothetical protein